VSSLVRSDEPADVLDTLRSRISELEALLNTRAAEIDQVRLEIGAFKNKYQQEVGWLHEELDELERAIAEAELRELSKRGDIPPPREAPVGARHEPLPRYTSDAVRKLFRDVAKTIHPDLAEDELTRDQRHTLMIEANRAYALGDEDRLRRILQAWERGAEAMRGSDPEAARTRLLGRIGQLEEVLSRLDDDLSALKDSPMWKLKTMVDEGAAQGRDLVREMVGRLKVDIMVARNRFEAIQTTF